jgi:hypothetical protein
MIAMVTMMQVMIIITGVHAWQHTSSSSSSSARLHPYRNNPSAHPVAVGKLMMVRRGRGSMGKEIGNVSSNDDDAVVRSSGGGGGMMNANIADGNGSSSSSSKSSINWTPLQVSVNVLPKEENKVSLIDTNLITLKNAQTNPTGAVSVIRFQQRTHCFAVNCPSCQIPLLKATCIQKRPEQVPAVAGGKDNVKNDDTTSSPSSRNSKTPLSSSSSPHLVCDLCKATYNLQTGQKVVVTTSNNNNGDTTATTEPIGVWGTIVKSIFSATPTSSGPLRIYQLGEKNGKLLISGLE